MTSDLLSRHCKPYPKGSPALDAASAQKLLAQLHDDWIIASTGNAIQRSFRFKNYYETLAFVNAMAWIIHREDHHPDLEVGYNRCVVNFSTHSVGGLSENDFICAAKIDALPSDAD
ncbi:MAG: 4a-hydroxytetrahydrobiopterin dehydratase [Gammaproteobacteria bacterium]|nr:4a-hydroxytetrahydrobiopterin dehydratase [Gammaproteobacteria bacterium]